MFCKNRLFFIKPFACPDFYCTFAFGFDDPSPFFRGVMLLSLLKMQKLFNARAYRVYQFHASFGITKWEIKDFPVLLGWKPNRQKMKRLNTFLLVGLSGIVMMMCMSCSNSESSNSNKQWKTYSNESISFNYPDNYKITDENDEDGRYITCELKGIDVSMIQFTCLSDEIFSLFDEQDKKVIYENSLEGMNTGLEKYLHNYNVSDMTEKTLGNCTGYLTKYSGSMFSIKVQGYSFVTISGNHTIMLITQAENEKYARQLDEILNTLKIE